MWAIFHPKFPSLQNFFIHDDNIHGKTKILDTSIFSNNEFGEQFHSCPIEFDQHLALADMTIPIPGIGIGITETISV
jgi:hypothetical protein